MQLRETTPSRDAGNEGDIQSTQAVKPKRKLNFASESETQEVLPTAAHQIAVKGLPDVFGVPVPRDETPRDQEQPSKRAKTEVVVAKGKERATGERPLDAASGSQVPERGAEAQSTQASDKWTLADYSATIGTLDEVQNLWRADLAKVTNVGKHQELKELREMIPQRMDKRKAINTDEFVRKWDELAKNGKFQGEMGAAIKHQQLRQSIQANRTTEPRPISLRWK